MDTLAEHRVVKMHVTCYACQQYAEIDRPTCGFDIQQSPVVLFAESHLRPMLIAVTLANGAIYWTDDD